jgi:hypothetical protein
MPQARRMKNVNIFVDVDLTLIDELIEGIVPKPDIIIDDMPGTCLNPFVFDVNQEESWEKLAKKLLDHYVA